MLTYNLTQRKDESKYYYIYKSIRRDIEGGTLKKGEKLPSKRSLAEHLGVSLITIENAYQMLKDEGYIEPRERARSTQVTLNNLNIILARKELDVGGPTEFYRISIGDVIF